MHEDGASMLLPALQAQWLRESEKAGELQVGARHQTGSMFQRTAPAPLPLASLGCCHPWLALTAASPCLAPQAEIAEESARVCKFIIDREIEAPERFQAIQSYRSAPPLPCRFRSAGPRHFSNAALPQALPEPALLLTPATIPRPAALPAGLPWPSCGSSLPLLTSSTPPGS